MNEEALIFAVRRWYVGGTTVELRLTDPSRLDEACAIAEARIRALGDACDRFREDAEVSRLRGRASQGVRVSPLLADLVQVALDAATETEGTVDPTLSTPGGDRDLRLLADDARPAGAAPGRADGWRRLRLEGDRLFVPDDVELDLGAIGTARTTEAAASVIASVTR